MKNNPKPRPPAFWSKLHCASGFRVPGTVLALLGLTALLAISALATSWENKDWTQWSSQDCYHILTTSPWAANGPDITITYSKSPGRTGETITGSSGEMLSALVVRQALVRQAQFEQHYNKMKAQDRQQFDALANACLNLKVDDQIVVRAIVPGTPDNIMPYLVVSGRRIPAIPALSAPQRNAVSPCPFPYWEPQPQAGQGHDLVFPRVVDGKPVIQPGDKKITIETPWGSELQFDLEKMIYKGKPDF